MDTFEDVEKAARGETIWRRGPDRDATPIPYRLTPDERQAFDAAKHDHYVVVRSRTRYNLHNIWYQWCCVARQPYIWLRRNRTYATVHMDMLPTYRKLTPEAVDEVMRLVIKAEIAPPAYYNGGDVIVHADRFLASRAEAVAARLWAIATAPRAVPVETPR